MWDCVLIGEGTRSTGPGGKRKQDRGHGTMEQVEQAGNANGSQVIRHSFVRRHELPADVDDIIRALGAFYREECLRVRMGLDADDDRNRAYLGTYFPRSFIEWATLWGELLSYLPVHDVFSRKRTITLASFGSGTGGDVVGALYALMDAGLVPERVRVYSYDGNTDALDKQQRILGNLRAKRVFPFELEFECREYTWGLDASSFEESCRRMRDMLPETVDLIQTSKWLVEFYNRDRNAAAGTIQNLLRFAETAVGPQGLVAALDLTTKDCGTWFPYLLNREAIAYLRAGGHLRTVTPIPCALTQGNCASGCRCFTQRKLKVSSSFGEQVPTKVCYRVFAPMEFASDITKTFADRPYYVAVQSYSNDLMCHRGRRTIVGDRAPNGFSGYGQG